MGNAVVITGCNGLLGREMAATFLREGWHVIGIDNVATSLPTCPGFDFIRFDLTQVQSYYVLAHQIGLKAKVLKCLINNAARNPKADEMKDFGAFETFPLLTWADDLWLNLTSPTYLTQALLPLFFGNKNKIINMISLYGIVSPNPALYKDESGIQRYKPISYCASKGGLLMVTKYLAAHLAPRFNVNGIAPGGIYTDSIPEEFVQKYSQCVPQGHMGSPKDVAEAALFLASDKSDYINGEILTVDGGYSIW